MDFDLDAQLQLLQRQLMAVQEQKTNPLSERTVAEIMVKLYHSGFAFIPTTDGNEYITPTQLDQEVADLVKERGKISLAMLPQLLNVGPDTLDSRLNSIAQHHPVTRHGGNLFSQRYFEAIITSVAQRLEQQGRVELESVAVEHEMKLQFAEKIIASNLHRLNAVKTGNQLITRQYTLLKKAKVLGFLAALNNPLQLQVLYRTIGGENKGIEELVNQLLEQGRVKGKIQNGYYVPDRFTSGQKRKVTQFLDNNGYIDLEMMQKKLLVARPEEWIAKNLGENFVKIERVYFKQAKLESLAAQANQMLKSEGFVELAHVLPIEFGEKALREFLQERCGLKDYFLCEGYCYSNDWLERLATEFKHKIIQNIFFKKPEPKGKDAKKKGKKEKTQLVTEQQLQEVLFNGGFTDYSGAESLAPQVLPLLLDRLDQLRKKIQKELAQSKGTITSAFLKYKSCKTIFRTEESLTRAINIIQKQIKKGEKWVDPDFGPNQTDPTGQYSVLYYDNILPKGWPSVETLKWQQFTPVQLLQFQKEPSNKPYPMRKCPLVALLHLVQLHNRKGFKLHHPQTQPLLEQSQLPLTYQFYINEKQKRTILVDGLLPILEGTQFASLGRYAFAQKAYAKLRYCYKGITGVGVQQILLEITGRNSIRYCADTEKQREILHQKLTVHLQRGDFVVAMAEGDTDKKLVIEQQESELYALHPYSLTGTPQSVKLQPNTASIPLTLLLQLFRNLFVIPSQ